MPTLADSVRRIRPRVLASAVAHLCGLDKRRMVETSEGVFLLNPVSYIATALAEGYYEPQTVEILTRFLPRGGVFLDLGANEGYFSVVASRLVGEAGTVIAVEPQSRLQSIIQANLTANHCSNVRLVRCVLSGRTGTARLSLSPDMHTGESTLFRQTRYIQPTEEVPSFTLADFLAAVGIRGCDLAKIDIEGAEWDVLMPAASELRSGALRHIAIEIHRPMLVKRGFSPEALHQHLVDCGYELQPQIGPYDYPSVYSFRSCPSTVA